MQFLRIFFSVGCFLLAYGMFLPNSWGFDEFGEKLAPTNFELSIKDFALQIKGRGRIGLHDLQGKGGPSFDSKTDTQTIGTRSPFVELDSFDLAFRFHWNEKLWINTSVAFYTINSYLSTIYFEYVSKLPHDFSHAIEIGYLSNIVATDRHTSRYPLIGTMFWKNPEFHIAYAVSHHFSASTQLSVFADLSMMRPLKSEPFHQSPTYRGVFSLLSYGSAKSFSGNTPAGTLRLLFQTHGFFAEAFGFLGQISTQSGLDTLVADFPYYRQQTAYSPTRTESLAWWAGMRLGYDGYGVHLLSEAIFSHEDLIEHFGWYAQLSYTFHRESQWFNRFELLFRYEQLFLLNSDTPLNSTNAMRSPDLINAITWDYQIATLAFHMNLFENYIALKLEYAFILEENGVQALNLATLPIDNNELLLQIEARF